jgi:hypothetical protein
MTVTIEGISVPDMGLTPARGGRAGRELLGTRRAKRIEANADSRLA